MKYYAYIVIDWLSGELRDQGIETEWSKCKEKTDKVRGSRFKSFPTMEEAIDWINDYTIYGKNKKYYAVYSSLIIGNNIFQDYPRLKALIELHNEEGISLRFKGFNELKEAELWFQEQYLK